MPQLEIPLCVTLAELAHRVSLHHSPLEVIRIINLCPPGDWGITLSFDDGGTRLRFEPASTADMASLVSTTPLGLFDYDLIALRSEGRCFAVDWRAECSQAPSDNVLR